MRKCVHCREWKDESAFAWSNKLLGIRQKHCRTCLSEFNKASYRKKSPEEKARIVNIAINHLLRLGRGVPLLVTLRPPVTPSRAGLIQMVQDAADRLYIYEIPVEVTQPPLW